MSYRVGKSPPRNKKKNRVGKKKKKLSSARFRTPLFSLYLKNAQRSPDRVLPAPSIRQLSSNVPYADIAKAGRAACKGGCGKQKFQKGEIRFGTWVKIAQASDGSWAWRHWFVISLPPLSLAVSSLLSSHLPPETKLTSCTRGCVTPKQFVNIRAKLTPEDGTLDVTSLDGYDELSEDLQTKVKEAIEQGHVADADWKGVSSLLPRGAAE